MFLGGQFREFRFYSPDLDTEAVRLSMANEAGQEYYAIVPSSSGRSWRQCRDEALDAIEVAMAAGDPPGEVVV